MPNVLPPSVDRVTYTPLWQSTLTGRIDRYTLPSGPHATTGSEARSQTPPADLVIPATGA